MLALAWALFVLILLMLFAAVVIDYIASGIESLFYP